MSAVLLYTQDMMMAIIERRWDDLSVMQRRQDQMLRSLFSIVEVSFSEQEKDDLLEVQRLNQEIILAVENHKADIANKLREMQQGKNKASAYSSL